jgi:hypothetical protein
MAGSMNRRSEKLEIKYFVVGLCVLLIIGGLYFRFLYDVPDSQEKTNNFVSWSLVVIGIAGMMVVGLWKSKNPLESFENDNVIHDGDNGHQAYSKDSDTPDADFHRDGSTM